MALLSLWTINAFAAPVSLEKALAWASRFTQSAQWAKQGIANVTFIPSHVERSQVNPAMADFYVLNASDDSSWMIVAGDDRVEEVLAYGYGSIDMTQLPCNMCAWLDMCKEQMEHLQAHPEIEVTRWKQAESPVTVSPLLASQWNQTRPFNLQCPLVGDTRCVTGCVATAMAQVMHYWKYPEELPALPSYTTSTLKIELPQLPSIQPMWQDMLDKYIYNSYTDDQGDAVATLMRYCGQACKMDYAPGQSGAYTWDMTDALKSFGYNSSMTEIMRYNYGDSVWSKLILEDLTAGRPILYSAENEDGGISHAFVIDGFDGTRYHVNWGWGGLSDGYFYLDSFSSGLNHRHSMLFNCFPEGVDGVKQAHDFEVDGVYYKVTGNGVRVTNAPASDQYSGHVIIPATVNYSGIGYPVTEIGPAAFADCPALTGVTIGSAISAIDDEAFARSSGLRRVVFSTSVDRVHHQAFVGCESLDTVEISSLESWCRVDFMDNEACPMTSAHHLCLNGEDIVHLIIPDGVTEVSANLFRNCDSLLTVVLPPSVTAINKYAFNNCKSLKSIQMGDAVTTLGYAALAGCVALNSVTLSAGLERIDRYAFRACKRLTEIVIPDQVKFIGSYAFKDCKQLARLTFGARVDTIGGSAFGSCTAIDTVICRAPKPPMLSARSCFHSTTYANAVLLVPSLSLKAYRSADLWPLFTTIKGLDTSCGPGDVNADGELNVADINALIALLLSGDAAPTTAADVDSDGEVTIADVNALIDLVLRNQ